MAAFARSMHLHSLFWAVCLSTAVSIEILAPLNGQMFLKDRDTLDVRCDATAHASTDKKLLLVLYVNGQEVHRNDESLQFASALAQVPLGAHEITFAVAENGPDKNLQILQTKSVRIGVVDLEELTALR